MSRIQRFEDLIAWQKARILTQRIYAVTQHGAFAKDYGLKDQIRRASVFIMSNLAEGFDRGTRPQFHQFCVIAKGSCAEVRCQLYIALDAGYLSSQAFQELYALSDEVSKIIAGLRKSLKIED